MKRSWRIMLVVVVLGIAAFGYADLALAQAPAPTNTAPAGQVTSCSVYVGLANRVVMCMRDTLTNVTHRYFADFYPLVQKVIGGFMTLVIVVYGVLAAFGMLEKPARDVMLLLIKLTFVTYFIVNADMMYARTLQVMDAAGAAVVEFSLNTNSNTNAVDLSQAECLKNMKEAAQRADQISPPWLAIDCMVDSVIGIKIAPHVTGEVATKGLQDLAVNRKLAEETGMARGLISFFFSSMQTSVLGIMFAVIGFIFLYTLIWLVVKALFVYIAGYIGIAFLMIFAPLFIPLVLFRVTKEYFNKWIKLVIGFALQPVVILVFISFSVAAVDLAMFSGDYSLMYRIAGDASRQDSFNLNQYLHDREIIKKSPAVLAGVKTGSETPQLNQEAIGGLVKDMKGSECVQAAMKADPQLKARCANFYPIQWWHDSVDWAKMAQARTPAVSDPGVEQGDAGDMTAAARQGRQISREVLAAIIFAAVVVAIMNGLLSVVPMMVNDLVGESFQSPNLYGATGRERGLGGLGGMLNNSINRLTGQR